MASLNTAEIHPRPGPSKKIKSNTGDFVLSHDADDDAYSLPLTPANKLGEDELTLIFSSDWITTQDLLNFRLVNKNWRDAATTTLLSRGACCVPLGRKTLWETETCGTEGLNYWMKYKLRKEKVQFHNLNQLTDLISNSPKFPATIFEIHTSTHFLKQTNDYTDLLHFFKLHGKKIKTLCILGWINQKFLLDCFNIYTPNLERIDLCEAEIVPMPTSKNKLKRMSTTNKAFSFQYLVLGNSWLRSDGVDPSNGNGIESHINKFIADSSREFLSLLLSTPTKLICILNVTLDTLQSVVGSGMGRIIRSFSYDNLMRDTFKFKPAIMKFLKTKPELLKLTVNLGNVSPLTTTMDTDTLNALIYCVKDKLEKLDINFSDSSADWEPRIKIPPMKNLSSINLHDHFEEEEEGEVNHVGGANIFEFENGISAENYFPNLSIVRLNPRGELVSDHNLLRFFKFTVDNVNGSTWDTFPTVDFLQIEKDSVYSNSPYTDKRMAELFTQIFPNVQILNIQCRDVKNLGSSLWSMCPKVEFMEIYDISSDVSHNNDNGTATDISLLVDKFFTGFSLEMVRKLQTTELPSENQNPDMLNFLRVAPSVCDLHYLRELKLNFATKLPTKFASHVTGTYSLSKMPSTKFIISYNPQTFGRNTVSCPAKWKNKNHQNAERNAVNLCFGAIKPYVQFVHENNFDQQLSRLVQ